MENSTKSDIGQLVRKLEQDYINGETTISKYVQRSMYEDLNKIDAYLNSRHTTGDTDSMGRDKPFFNIVTAAVNIWYRATVVYLKNIKIKATVSRHVITAFLATVHLKNWMRRENFGAFLNDWGRALARYGSSVLKFVEKEGRLFCEVVPWNRLIVDAVDFDNNIKIEVLNLTEAQLLSRKGYDREMVQKLLDARAARETIGKDKVDTKDEYIKLYEVHGELPLSYITNKEADKNTYVQQMHVISFVAGKEKGEFDDFTLISGREEKDRYMITHLIKEDGQTLSIGAVMHLFEAQWMMNHTTKAIKDQLDLTSKLIFQTSDGNFVGQNALTAIENGDILIHSVNQPLTQINNGSHDISSLQAFGNQWKALSNEISGISEAMLGNTPPAGTAWRQVEALLNESHSLFEVMTENKNLYVEEMLRRYIIPFLKKKMDTAEEVSATLEDYDITKIDARYIKNESVARANYDLVQAVIDGAKPTPEDQMSLIAQHQNDIAEQLSSFGSDRFFKPDQINWKKEFDGFEWEAEVETSNNSNTGKEDMATLTTVLQTLANPATAQVIKTPEGKFVFNRILQIAGGVSPLELSSLPQSTVQSPLQGSTNPMALQSPLQAVPAQPVS